MDRFIFRYPLIKLIRVFYRTVFNTGGATGAFFLNNISRLCAQGDLKVSCGSFHMINFGKCEYLYVRMPADLDQFR